MGGLDAFYSAHSALVHFLGINALLALSMYVTLAAGQLALANAAFFGIGAYTSALLTVKADAPFVLALAGGAIVPALIAVPLGVPLLRLRGVFLAIATISFGEVVRIVALNWEYTGGALGLGGIPHKTKLWQILLALAVVLYLFWRMRGSRMGYALAAIRVDESAAKTMGIDTGFYKLVAFVSGAGLAGLAGGLSAHFIFFISPGNYGFTRAVDILVYAIVGGTSHFAGPVIGAWVITLIPEYLRSSKPFGIAPGPATLFANGLILLSIMLFLPNGLVSLFGRLPRFHLSRRSRRPDVDAAQA
jgi:branched-chain amino acid transport system permease protein